MQTQLERDLIATRDRIKDRQNWTQGGIGYRPERLGLPRAECWSVAAMMVVGGGIDQSNGGRSRYMAVMSALAATFSDDELVRAERKYRGPTLEEKIGVLPAWSLVIGFNDSHTHARLMARCNRAIGIEQERQRPPRRPRIAYDTTEAVAELRRKALEPSHREQDRRQEAAAESVRRLRAALVAYDEGGGAVAAVVEKV